MGIPHQSRFGERKERIVGKVLIAARFEEKLKKILADLIREIIQSGLDFQRIQIENKIVRRIIFGVSREKL